MTAPHVELIRRFEPGTTGWSADDLDDPEIERLWFQGAYEIVEGVLTKMPPAYFDGSIAVQRLVDVVDGEIDARLAGEDLREHVLQIDAGERALHDSADDAE